MDRFRTSRFSTFLRQARHLSVASLFLCAAMVTSAQTARGPEWSQLGAREQYILKPLAQGWDQLDAARKAKWLSIAKQYQKLEPEQQARLQERMVSWSQLSPEERTLARMNFAELRSVPKSERQAQWEAYNALPDETKQELARKAAERQQALTHAPSSAASAAPSADKAWSVLKGGKPVGPVTIQANTGVSTRTLAEQRMAARRGPRIDKTMVMSGLQGIHPRTLLPRPVPQTSDRMSAPRAAAPSGSIPPGTPSP